jgi:radical SAM protein with 4Fe4S-binding SPASM domain
MDSVAQPVVIPAKPMAPQAAGERAKSAPTPRRPVPPFPPIVYIEPTNVCNCNCTICPRQTMKRDQGYMAMSLFRRIVDQLATAGPVDVRLFNFGEPLLHPAFPEMIRIGREAGLRVTFQTNGLLLTEPVIRKLLAAGVTYFGVSANGLGAEEYEQIRPGHKFSDFKANLTRLRTIAAETGQAIFIHINAQVLRENRPQLKREIEHYAREWTSIADSVSVSGLSLFDGVSFPHYGARRASRLADLVRRDDSEIACTEPFDRLVIKWDGRVTPCCVDFDACWVVGDVRVQPLRDIWNSARMTELRAAVENRHYSRIPICLTCPKFYSREFTLTLGKQKPGTGA